MTVDRHYWQEDAACRKMAGSIFFPDHRILNDDRWDIPRLVCADCVVKSECLEMVLKFEDTDDKWGMFGGKTPAERRVIRDERHRVR